MYNFLLDLLRLLFRKTCFNIWLKTQTEIAFGKSLVLRFYFIIDEHDEETQVLCENMIWNKNIFMSLHVVKVSTSNTKPMGVTVISTLSVYINSHYKCCLCCATEGLAPSSLSTHSVSAGCDSAIINFSMPRFQDYLIVFISNNVCYPVCTRLWSLRAHICVLALFLEDFTVSMWTIVTYGQVTTPWLLTSKEIQRLLFRGFL